MFLLLAKREESQYISQISDVKAMFFFFKAMERNHRGEKETRREKIRGNKEAIKEQFGDGGKNSKRKVKMSNATRGRQRAARGKGQIPTKEQRLTWSTTQ